MNEKKVTTGLDEGKTTVGKEKKSKKLNLFLLLFIKDADIRQNSYWENHHA